MNEETMIKVRTNFKNALVENLIGKITYTVSHNGENKHIEKKRYTRIDEIQCFIENTKFIFDNIQSACQSTTFQDALKEFMSADIDINRYSHIICFEREADTCYLLATTNGDKYFSIKEDFDNAVEHAFTLGAEVHSNIHPCCSQCQESVRVIFDINTNLPGYDLNFCPDCAPLIGKVHHKLYFSTYSIKVTKFDENMNEIPLLSKRLETPNDRCFTFRFESIDNPIGKDGVCSTEELQSIINFITKN